jgi:MFS family permease
MTVLFPFIYYMVRDFGYPQDDVGYYVGWIASSFSLSQFFTAYLWGYLSDKIGRRPVLLIGLIGNSISTCLFGLSKTLIWVFYSSLT